jgi:hypothetical protein
MVRIGTAERARLLAAQPDTYYVTDHYVGHSAVLVRLAKSDRESLAALLQKSWFFVREK